MVRRPRPGLVPAAALLVIGGSIGGSIMGAPVVLAASPPPPPATTEVVEAATDDGAVAALPRELDTPPGLDSRTLRRLSPQDPLAWDSLETALLRLEERWPLPEPTPPAGGPPSDGDAGVRAYIRARAAAEEGRWLIAATELERARGLLPESPQIARLLARAYERLGSPARAGDELLRAAALDSSDPGTLVLAARWLVEQRQPEAAAALLARAWSETDGGSELAARLGAGPAVDAWFVMGEALRRSGRETAAAEAATIALAELDALPVQAITSNPRLGERFRGRAETWKAVGDSAARRGLFDEALLAYERAVALPMADPGSLDPRVLWAHLQRGRPEDAVAALEAILAADPESLRAADATLAGWLLDSLDDPEPLAARLAALARANPSSAPLLQLAAITRPAAEAAELLDAHLRAHPGSVETIAPLLVDLAERSPDRALAVVADLVEGNPALLSRLMPLLHELPIAPEQALTTLESMPMSPGRDAILVSVLVNLRDLGGAWEVVERSDAPADDPVAAITRLAAARALEEPWLVQEAVADAAAEPALGDDPAVGLAAVGALVRAGLFDEGAARAEGLAAQFPENPYVQAIRAEALVWTIRRGGLPDGERLALTDAIVSSAEAAIALDPTCRPAWTTLLAVWATRDGLAPDANRRQEVVDKLQVAAPEDGLALITIAAERLSRGDLDGAIELALPLGADPELSSSAIDILLVAWSRTQRLDEAERWLRERVRSAPMASPPREALIRMLAQTGRVEEAEALLREWQATAPRDLRSEVLLESIWRASERERLACESGRLRLASRPEGPRRALETAALEVGCGDGQAVAEQLRWLLDHEDRLSRDHTLSAIEIAGRGDDLVPERDAMLGALCESFVRRFPEPPMAVLGPSILAAVRSGVPDAEILTLVRRAIDSREGSLPTPAGAQLWVNLAQALIDDYRPELAAAMLRRRVLDGPRLQEPAVMMLVRASVAADAAGGLVDPSIEFVSTVAEELGGWPPALEAASTSTLQAGIPFWISTVNSLLGEPRAAAAALEAVLRIEPNNGMAANNLGYQRLEAGDLGPRTVDLIEGAYATLPRDASVLDSIGWLRYRQGQLEDDDGTPGAVSLLEMALARAIEDPSIEMLDHLGDAYWRVGRHDDASALWARAIEISAVQYPRDRMTEVLEEYQRREFGVRVRDPREMYDRQFGEITERLQRKLEQVRDGLPPSVAPIAGENGAERDGRS